MAQQLGVGVLGLQEGLTMLVALSEAIPPSYGAADPPRGERRMRRARAVAGCDLRPERVAAARARCPDLFYTTSYAEMLARDDVDVVCIYTPDRLHGEHVAQAFAAGKHVICTKPLVNAVADARALARLTTETDRRLLVGQSTRFFAPFLRQRAAYERGDIGRVELLDAHYVHRMDWFYEKSPWAATETDWVFLGMSHPVDLARWYLGAIEEVHALASRSALAERYGVRSFDICTVNLRSADGTPGRVLGHYGLHELPSARNAIELLLLGSAGSSMAQYHDMRYLHTSQGGEEVREDLLYSHRAFYFNNETHGAHYGEFANYVEHFAEALQEGRPHAPDLREGLETFCVMEAIRRSAASGQPVRVAPILVEIGL